MRHPLWILNSAIAVLLIIAFLFMFFLRPRIPYREPIEPELSNEGIKRDEIKINLSKIYENDIFDTYQKEFKQPIAPIQSIPVPQPPIPERPFTPEIPKPKFLDPLNISLKGIVVIASDDSKNRAVIQDNQTKQEEAYKVGNTFGDAQLIRIFNNKVIFLRSNGQQEVLYLREKDAELDPTYAALSGWENVVQKIDNYRFNVNPQMFTKRIQNLAQFIDMLDLTTAFQKGKSIGCRVGQTKKHSLGAALGFLTGDIITYVNDIPATDTPGRFQIYKEIIAGKPDTPIRVQVLRNNDFTTLTYTLEDFKIIDKLKDINPAQELALEEKMKEKQIKAMQQKHSFAPNIRDLKKKERRNMLSRGSKPYGYKPTQITEK